MPTLPREYPTVAPVATSFDRKAAISGGTAAFAFGPISATAAAVYQRSLGSLSSRRIPASSGTAAAALGPNIPSACIAAIRNGSPSRSLQPRRYDPIG